MFILDTNICIAYLNGDRAIHKRFRDHYDRLAVPSVVAAELHFGAKMSTRVAENVQKLELFLSGLQVLDFDIESARAYGEIQAGLRRVGRPTGVVDAMIAAITIARNGTLVTHNTRDFENISDLRIEDWLE